MFGASKYRSWLRHPGYNLGGGSDGGSENAATIAQGRMLDYNLEKLKQTDSIRDPYMAGGLQGAMSAYDKYDSPGYIDQQVGLANADTTQAIGRNTAAMNRSLGQYGINPNSGRFAATANQNALAGAAMQAGAMNQTRMGLADRATTAATNKWKMLNDMQTDSMTQGNQIAGGYGQQGQAIMAGNQANAQANAGMGSAMMGAADMYLRNSEKINGWFGYADGGRVSLTEQRRTMGLGDNFGTPQAAGPNPVVQGLSIASRGTNLYQKGAAGLAHNTSIETAKAAQAAAAGTGQAATGLSAAGQQAGMLAAQDVGLGAAAEGAAGAALAEGTTGALAAGVETAAAANAWNPVGWVLGAAALFGALSRANGGEVAKPVKAPFEQRREVFEGVFDEKYTGSKAQDDMMLAYLQGRMEAEQSAAQPAAQGRQDMTGGGPVAGPGTTSSDSIPAWLSDKEHVVNAEAASLPGVRPALDAINRAGLELRGQA